MTDKSDYVRALIIGHTRPALDVALLYWHSGIPLDEARAYMHTYMSKQNGKRMVRK